MCEKKIIKILLAADEGCICCASELIKLFVKKFPECRKEFENYKNKVI